MTGLKADPGAKPCRPERQLPGISGDEGDRLEVGVHRS
jgi:hypothetical protein